MAVRDGWDRAEIRLVEVYDVEVVNHDGDDSVYMNEVHAVDGLYVDLDTGCDVLHMLNAIASSPFSDGEANGDIIYDLSNGFDEMEKTMNGETVLPGQKG